MKDYKNSPILTPAGALLLRLERKLTAAWDWLDPKSQWFIQGAAITALVLLALSLLLPPTSAYTLDTAVLTADRWVCTHAAPAGLHADCTAYERKRTAQ